MLDISMKDNMVSLLCEGVSLPKMAKVRQIFDKSHIDPGQIPQIVAEQLGRQEIAGQIRPGMSVAITCGSRGVANVAVITRAIVDFVKARGALPFVFPAMGSHGGATVEGQLEILEGYGVTEASMGCPIRASMETVQIGSLEDGLPVFIDKYASEADGIILCGRIKAHTTFRGTYESGLVKMAVIGMGKQRGAETAHESGFAKLGELMPRIARVIFGKSKIICGLGLIENALDQTCKITALTKEEIWDKEPDLLIEAKSRMGRILLDNIDILVIDRIGKDISGDGMDPNVTGRFSVPDAASGGISVRRIAVLDLTAATHGNALGMGMADATTRRMAQKISLDMTYPNAITSTVLDIVKVPLIAGSDKTAIQLCLRSCNGIDRANPRIVRIQDTMHLEEIMVSEAMLPEVQLLSNMEIIEESKEFAFNANGDLW